MTTHKSWRARGKIMGRERVWTGGSAFIRVQAGGGQGFVGSLVTGEFKGYEEELGQEGRSGVTREVSYLRPPALLTAGAS